MRKNVVYYFKEEIFPYKGNLFKTKEENSEDKSEDQSEKKESQKMYRIYWERIKGSKL